MQVKDVHEEDLGNWQQFEDRLKSLENKRSEQGTSSNFLYRGQEDKSFELSSTLERYGATRISLNKYHELISSVKPQIESFTRLSWNILSYPEGFNNWLQKNGSALPTSFGWSAEFQDTYSYMAYLRHYGFPSPMIDWTSSPYVAAYFAFRKPPQKKNNDVSIYVYLESKSPSGIISRQSNKPNIYRFGPYVNTDRRHFLQQSQYTICIINAGAEWQYTSHEEAFVSRNPEQNILWKFNIPYSERDKVLKLLDTYNLNALSLLGSTESLMETMTLRELIFKGSKYSY